MPLLPSFLRATFTADTAGGAAVRLYRWLLQTLARTCRILPRCYTRTPRGFPLPHAFLQLMMVDAGFLPFYHHYCHTRYLLARCGLANYSSRLTCAGGWLQTLLPPPHRPCRLCRCRRTFAIACSVVLRVIWFIILYFSCAFFGSLLTR